MTADQISKNLKLVGMDIGVHSILLVTGVVIPTVLFLMSLVYIETCSVALGCFNTPRFFGFAILFCFGCLSIIWQIISLSLSSKYREAENEKTRLIRKIMTIYYCVLVFGLVGLISDPFFPVSIPLFLISPIFWLFYYINLFSQKKNLELELNKISTVSTVSK
jgi:hypothetical protein